MLTLEKVSLFWDVDHTTLDIEQHFRFIVERILSRGDVDDLKWALETYGQTRLKEVVVSARSLDPRSLNFWQLYFSLSPSVCIPKLSQRTPSAFWTK
jgi:hypothetical protein